MIKFVNILLIHLYFFINCQNCIDQNCLSCSKDGYYCYKCIKGFIKHYSKCGIKCNSIKNCEICNEDKSNCIKCKSNWVFTGTYCDCTERYTLALILILFSIILFTVVFYCLIHTSSRRSIFNIFSVRITPSILNRVNASITQYPLPEEVNANINNKIKELELINDFNKNKIEIDKDIENKKCFICKNNICNLKMECGCFICFECEKKCVKVNLCLNCNKPISTMQQVSCSICFCNKKEISTFNCPCKTVICKDCYLKWRKENNFCPSCRGIII